jgi:hypothetical protein
MIDHEDSKAAEGVAEMLPPRKRSYVKPTVEDAEPLVNVTFQSGGQTPATAVPFIPSA